MADVKALILLVVFILILTSLAPTIITNTETKTCAELVSNETGRDCSLENSSASAKAMWGMTQIFYVLIGIFGILAVIGIGKAKKR